MRINPENQNLGRWLRLGLVLAFMLFAAEAQATLVIDSATVDGGATTTVAAGGTISLSITVTSSGGGASNDWLATGWLIANASGPLTCFNHSDYTASGTYTETFDITAPATAGTFNVYLVAYRKDDCTGGNSPEFVLANAVITTTVSLACVTYRDEFSNTAYNNQDGSFNWATDWNEVADDASPSGGNIFITSSSLRFQGGLQPATVLNGRYIEREADLTGFSTATLAFDYRQSGNWESNDEFDVHVSADGGTNWSLIQRFSDDHPNSFQPYSFDLTPYIASNTRIAFVIRSNNAGESSFIDNVQIEACAPVLALDHFAITPATTNASTCLPNAVTIIAEDVSGNPITAYTGTVNISTSSGNGNWSINDADNVTNPNPDNDDNGSVDYSFLVSDAGEIVLDLSNSQADTLTISVSDAFLGVTSTSVTVNFSDNVFVFTEDPVQIAGRPQAMSIEMWTNNGSNCFNDTSYDYNPQTLEASIDRAGVLPGANNPSIGGVSIPQGPASGAISLDFSAVPGQAGFNLDSTDVGQYRLTVTDNSNVHSVGVIVGTSNILTVRPFGIGISNIRAGATVNMGFILPGDPEFTIAGADFEATVAGVLWVASDDTDDDGVLDNGLFYYDNPVAPSYAWTTVLSVSGAPMTFWPEPGTPGVLNNATILPGEFAGGSFNVTDLQYTEVGSFTLQTRADNFLGEASADIVGDSIVVGRFIPAAFDVSITQNGVLEDSCGVIAYIGQDFSYATAPEVTINAQNALGATTVQYRAGFSKLFDGSISVDASQDEIAIGTDSNPLLVSYTVAAMTLTPGNGSVDYRFGADVYRYGPDLPLTTFSKFDESKVPPFPANIRPEIQSISDGEVTTVFTPGTHRLTPIGNNMRFGRLRMNNVHGSELNSLLMLVYTEYWTGTGWTKSATDTCTSIADTDLVSLAIPLGLSTPSVFYTPFASAGNVDYTYPAPGAGNKGHVDTTTDLSLANHLWLRYDWDSDGVFDDDPSARATFGIFEGDPVQIYFRQVY